MAAPFFSSYDAISTPNGTWVRPGGNVVAYVRSTGAQSGDDPFAASGALVATIAAGVNRCRPGQNDVVVVLPGHTETVTTTLFTPVAGAQIVGAGRPGSTNAPNITLSATAATIALSAANMSLIGLNINSATAAVVDAIVVSAAGCTIANCFISFTGALAANPGIEVVAGGDTFSFCDNYVSVSSTGNILNFTAGTAIANFRVTGNHFRQLAASGSYVNVASQTGTGGLLAYNTGKATGAAPLIGVGFTIGANSIATVAQIENYAAGNTTVSGASTIALGT
jgi:hypothetical protein